MNAYLDNNSDPDSLLNDPQSIILLATWIEYPENALKCVIIHLLYFSIHLWKPLPTQPCKIVPESPHYMYPFYVLSQCSDVDWPLWMWLKHHDIWRECHVPAMHYNVQHLKTKVVNDKQCTCSKFPVLSRIDTGLSGRIMKRTIEMRTIGTSVANIHGQRESVDSGMATVLQMRAPEDERRVNIYVIYCCYKY